MPSTRPCDSRGFFVLPQAYEGGGYYTYGTPNKGESQYLHPQLMSALSMISFAWVARTTTKFGIGNISLADGTKHPDHAGHRSGLDVDIRTLRLDGKRLPCNIHDSQYDRKATEELIGLFLNHARVKFILFNDMRVKNVKFSAGHGDHFHVSLKG